MDNVKNDLYYADKIRKDLAFIVKQMRGTSLEDLAEHEILQDSMLFRLIQISENAKRLSDNYKENRPGIPWTAIYGLRSRIVGSHHYSPLKILK